jgi:signal transduction histidine kinase/ligand-binding sensor domain-containing protein
VPWVGAEDGVFRYSEETRRMERVPVSGLAPDPDPAIVTSMAFDHSGMLWISTWMEGLFAYDRVTRKTRQYRHDPDNEHGLGTDRLAMLTVDSAGDVWIGSWGEGIYRFNADAGIFSRILAREGDPAGLPYPEVTSVLEDRRGRLWVGTWGQGLVWKDDSEEAFSIVPPTESENPGEMSTPLALAEDVGGRLWVGSMAGLYLIDREGGVERSLSGEGGLFDGDPLPYVNAIVLDDDGRVWIGAGGKGLFLLDPGDGLSAHYRSDPRDPSSLSDDHVTSLCLDSRDGLWVGTRSGGLNRLDKDSGRFERFLPDPDDPHSLGHHTVTSIIEDRQGTIWAGTAGGGFSSIAADPAGGWRMARIGVTEGLVNASVVSIREDDDGSLWIGTRGGLSRYQPDTGRFHNYGPGDGLPSLEFRPNASAAGTERLYFGTLGGVLGIARGSAFDAPAPTPTLLTGIRTLDGPWPVTAPTWETREIKAPYGTMLSLEFGVLDLRPPHRFAYRLEGESDEWVDLGSRREITFAGLPPGNYDLTVRGLNSRGVWSEWQTPLRMRIVPPFWMTWWFRAGVVLFVAGLVWTWIQVRFAALERRNRQLEALHRDRETALEQARESEQALQRAYESLRGLTRRLEDAKEEERQRIARELHDEMGQALSAIKINLKALGRLGEDTNAGERIADALTLVDGIIRNVRALSLDLRPPLLDELGLVAALRGYTEGQAERTGIDIAVEANADAMQIPAEIGITAFRIVQESIHNALRHANAEHITVSVRRDPGRLTLTVRDDGTGFDVVETLARAVTGRHLGLLGMRERVEALGGSFEILSEPGQGTVIDAGIPLERSEVSA